MRVKYRNCLIAIAQHTHSGSDYKLLHNHLKKEDNKLGSANFSMVKVNGLGIMRPVEPKPHGIQTAVREEIS